MVFFCVGEDGCGYKGFVGGNDYFIVGWRFECGMYFILMWKENVV